MEEAVLGSVVTHSVRMHRLHWFSPEINIGEAAVERNGYVDKLKNVSECRQRGTLDKKYWLDNGLVSIAAEIAGKVIILVVMIDGDKEEQRKPKTTEVEFYIHCPHPQDNKIVRDGSQVIAVKTLAEVGSALKKCFRLPI